MLSKLKTILFSIVPIVLFIVLINFFVFQFDAEILIRFVVSAVLLMIGQIVFLTGIDSSIVPMGNFVGNSIFSAKRFYIYIIFALVFGAFSTIAEPDLQVFANQVVVAGFPISRISFLFLTGAGVGLFMAFALVRIVKKIPFCFVLFGMYLIVFVLALFVDENVFAMVLDSGASVSGVVTSPFLLALGLGVSKVVASDSREDGAFGMIALCSVGPLISLLIYFLFAKEGTVYSAVEVESQSLLLSTLLDVTLSLLPLILIFFVFEFFFIKISKQDKLKLVIGSIITFAGFFIFLFSVEFGFVDMAKEFGVFLAKLDSIPLVILICAFIGFFIVFSEPAIRVLANQVENVTNRNIKAWLVIAAIGIAVMLSLIMIVLKFYIGISIWWFFGVTYGLTFIMMFFVPSFFNAISFDAGGVATGTMTIAFLFPMMIGFSGSGIESFGVVAILSFIPILVMQTLGALFSLFANFEKRKTQKIFIRLSKTDDIYSNIENLRLKHEKFIQQGEVYEK